MSAGFHSSTVIHKQWEIVDHLTLWTIEAMADGDRIVDVVDLMFPFISSLGSSWATHMLWTAEADWTEIILGSSITWTKRLFNSNLILYSDAGAPPLKLSWCFEEETPAVDPIKLQYLLVNCKSLIWQIGWCLWKHCLKPKIINLLIVYSGLAKGQVILK